MENYTAMELVGIGLRTKSFWQMSMSFNDVLIDGENKTSFIFVIRESLPQIVWREIWLLLACVAQRGRVDMTDTDVRQLVANVMVV